MAVQHPPELIRELQGITTPTIANAIELFNLRPREAGFASGTIRCIFPALPAVVGYACTATIKAASPPGERRAGRGEMWQHILSMPAPRIIVVQDEDDPRPSARSGARSTAAYTRRWAPSPWSPTAASATLTSLKRWGCRCSHAK